MKYAIFIFVLVFLFSGSSVFASGSVLVYPTITNSNGGTRFANDLYTRIDYSDGNYVQSGVPTYSITGSYTVTPILPSGYSATLRGDCQSSVIDGEKKTCYVDWQDGAPIVEPVVEAPPEYVPPPVGAEVPSEPQIIYVPVPEKVEPIIQYVPVCDEECIRIKTLNNVYQFEEAMKKSYEERNEASTTEPVLPPTKETLISKIYELILELINLIKKISFI